MCCFFKSKDRLSDLDFKEYIDFLKEIDKEDYIKLSAQYLEYRIAASRECTKRCMYLFLAIVAALVLVCIVCLICRYGCNVTNNMPST